MRKWISSFVIKWGILVFIGLLCLNPVVKAQTYYNYNSPYLEAASEAIANIQLPFAQAYIAREYQAYPDNLAAVHLEHYVDFVDAILCGNYVEAVEDDEHFNALIHQLEQGDQQSPYYRFALGDIYLQRSLMLLRDKSYFSGFRMLRKGYKLLEKNMEEFPDFHAQWAPYGFVQAMMGTIPDNYKWAVELFGFTCDYTMGAAYLENGVEALLQEEKETIFLKETYLLASVLYTNLSGKRELAANFAEQILRNQPDSIPFSTTDAFVLAFSYMKSYQSAKAIPVIVEGRSMSGGNYVPQMDYLLGKAYLYQQNEQCVTTFYHYLEQVPTSEYKAAALRYIAWFYLMQGESYKYQLVINKIDKEFDYALQEDKAAQQEAITGDRPNPAILRGRLLFDGGYFHDAEQQLRKLLEEGEGLSSKEIMEAQYRLGRVLQESGNEQEAVPVFQHVIKHGKDKPYYYAAAAALQLGYIMEQQRRFPAAEYRFRQCLEMDFETYRTGIRQKAKAGVARVNEQE